MSAPDTEVEVVEHYTLGSCNARWLELCRQAADEVDATPVGRDRRLADEAGVPLWGPL